MNIINIQATTSSSGDWSAPAQRVTILDQTNVKFPRQLVLSTDGIKIIRGTNVVGITTAQLFALASTSNPVFSWAPIILTQPTSSTVTHGANSTASFSVSASAETAITYAWKYQASGSIAPITGALPTTSGSNAATLHMNCLTVAPFNSSSLVCYLTDASGNTTSSAVNLYIL